MKAFGRRTELIEIGQRSERTAPPPSYTPPPRPQEPPALVRLRDEVMGRIDPAAVAQLSHERLREELEGLSHEVAERERLELTARDQARLAEELTQDMVGYGPLDPLLHDEAITERAAPSAGIPARVLLKYVCRGGVRRLKRRPQTEQQAGCDRERASKREQTPVHERHGERLQASRHDALDKRRRQYRDRQTKHSPGNR